LDFGKVLDDWERLKRDRAEEKAVRAGSALSSWLDAHGVPDKDEADAREPDGAAEARRLAALRPQARLDLHGKTAEEARAAIFAFLAEAAGRGLEKVLIIHGKGLHSEGAPVLKKAARAAVESNPLAGRSGEAAREDGGSGAMWVAVRDRRKAKR
jgi:DNA-nicking Smr family endonuclease